MSTDIQDAKFDTVKERPGGRSSQVKMAVMNGVRSELSRVGYSKLSHRGVAAAADVNHVTVYRRWPTKARLVADLFRDLAADLVPIPDTGSLHGDFDAYLSSIVQMLNDQSLKHLLQTFFVASFDGDEAVESVISEIWRERFSDAEIMIDRAVERAEIPVTERGNDALECLVSPVWFRTFISRKPIDGKFIDQLAAQASSLLKTAK
ncbi:TetR/AcrR family transcriptional regulator [Ochrobactrum quorumnocens]|uniref:TetR/AcrR family transcriptional regulator n=1 Tax=Ochrobactrum quorumnocens TaxID=271865 RepID=UPI000BA8459A|nr:TetR/AcrR family transcriptional regulator [[Ochrobactrum] quorumnocens]